MKVLVTIIDKSAEKANVGRKLEKEFKKDMPKRKRINDLRKLGFFEIFGKLLRVFVTLLDR